MPDKKDKDSQINYDDAKKMKPAKPPEKPSPGKRNE